MINYDLIEGLRIALAKGYTLEQAMMSFYNAGYPKEEIEEAARILLYHPSQTLTHPDKEVPEKLKKPVKALPSTRPATGKPSKEKEKTAAVSVYGEKEKTKTKAVISILIIILFILLVILGGIIIFKDALINFFANLF